MVKKHLKKYILRNMFFRIFAKELTNQFGLIFLRAEVQISV